MRSFLMVAVRIGEPSGILNKSRKTECTPKLSRQLAKNEVVATSEIRQV